MQKKTFIPVMLLLFMLLGFRSRPIEIGASLPLATNEITDVSGKSVTLKSAARKNGLLVMFTCNTCPFVVKNQARTIAICKFARANDIGIVLLNSNEANRNAADSYEKMQEYAKVQDFQWIYALDKNSAIANAFDASRTPECYLFDKNLELAYHGAIDDNPQDAQNVTREHLKIAITEIAGGKEVSQKETRSIGCGIKRAGE